MLRFAEDIAQLASTKKGLEMAHSNMEAVINEYDMKMNTDKNRVRACRKNNIIKRLKIKIGYKSFAQKIVREKKGFADKIKLLNF